MPATVLALGFMSSITPRLFRRFGDHPSELAAKFLLVCPFGLEVSGPDARRAD